MLFEVGLARHAADHASGAEIGDLGAALAANKDALGNGAAFHRTDVAFHYVLAVIPKNPIFTAVHAGIIDWLTATDDFGPCAGNE